MTTWKDLSRPLRALFLAPSLLLLVLAAGAATTGLRSLSLDAANQPTAPVSLAGPNWTGSPDSLTGLLYGNGTGNLSAATGAQVSGLVTGDINPSNVGLTKPGTGNFTTLSATGFSVNSLGGFPVVSTSLQMIVGSAVKISAYGGSVIDFAPSGTALYDVALSRTGPSELAITAGNGVNPGNLALGDLTANGFLSSDGGTIFSDGNGVFTADNLVASHTIAASTLTVGDVFYVGPDGHVIMGSIYSDGGTITTDGQGNLSCQALSSQGIVNNASFSSDGGNMTTDGGGDLTVGGNLNVEGGSGLYVNQLSQLNGVVAESLSVIGASSLDQGTIGTDGSGNISANGVDTYDHLTTSQIFCSDTASVYTLSVAPITYGSFYYPTEGTIQAFTDSTTNTWGAVIGGGGSFHVLGYYDGTHWTVLAK